MRNEYSSAVEKPSLDAIAAKPETVRGLSREALFSLALQAQAVQLACAMAMIEGTPGHRPPDVDEVLGVDEAARRLGISPKTLQHEARKRYRALVIEDGVRTLRFSANLVEQWKAAHAGSRAVSPAGPPLGRKRREPAGPASTSAYPWLRTTRQGSAAR